MRADVQREDARSVARYHHDLERDGSREFDARVNPGDFMNKPIKT